MYGHHYGWKWEHEISEPAEIFILVCVLAGTLFLSVQGRGQGEIVSDISGIVMVFALIFLCAAGTKISDAPESGEGTMAPAVVVGLSICAAGTSFAGIVTGGAILWGLSITCAVFAIIVIGGITGILLMERDSRNKAKHRST